MAIKEAITCSVTCTQQVFWNLHVHYIWLIPSWNIGAYSIKFRTCLISPVKKIYSIHKNIHAFSLFSSFLQVRLQVFILEGLETRWKARLKDQKGQSVAYLLWEFWNILLLVVEYMNRYLHFGESMKNNTIPCLHRSQ